MSRWMLDIRMPTACERLLLRSFTTWGTRTQRRECAQREQRSDMNNTSLIIIMIARRQKKKKRRGVRAPRRVYFWEGQAEPSRRQAELRAQMYPFPQIFHIHHLLPAQINHRAKQARVPSAARTHKLKAGTWRERERGRGLVCISADM